MMLALTIRDLEDDKKNEDDKNLCSFQLLSF